MWCRGALNGTLALVPQPVTVVSQLICEIAARFDDPSIPVEAPELRTMLARLRREQRNAPAGELATLFNSIGLVLVRLGNWRDALDAFRNAARYDRDCAYFPNNVAHCLAELGRFPEAMATLRDAVERPEKPPGVLVCILTTKAEIQHHLGDEKAARESYEEAVRRADSARAIDFHNVAVTAAVLGLEEDATELFARSMALARGVDLAERDAVEFLLSDPDYLKAGGQRSAVLHAALMSVAQRHAADIPHEHQVSARVDLEARERDTVNEMLAHPPEPTAALRRVFDEPRA